MSLQTVDWAQPWLGPYREDGAAAAQAALQCTVAAALQGRRRAAAVPDFAAHGSLPPGTAYEAHIHASGSVPTRDNLHDFFNGLVWLAFPLAKRRLNKWQAAQIARDGIGATRGPLRDALTLFDENGAVLRAPPALWRALVARDWRALFVTHRARWADAQLLVFGHALLEKLVVPRKPATAHVLMLPASDSALFDPRDDAALARRLDAQWLARKPFAPLPVLGVPGWWAANEAPDFYDDPKVFRPRA